MTIFKAHFNNGNGNIELTMDTPPIIAIPITSLLLNDGNNATNNDVFEKHQQQVNYLDSIKDRTNVFMLQGLNIYPKAGEGSGVYPTFPNTLKDFEHNIFKTRKDYLTHTTWLKVKKGSVLDPGKEYNQCLWESGLGYEVFLHDPDNVETIKTFGSFIDPLEKQNAKKVWPPINSSVELTEGFMKLMGFGNFSSLTATAKTNTTFNYTMNIGCGDVCAIKKGTCYLRETNDDENVASERYFAGNNEKKQFLKTNATTKSKVKFVVIKEWGDKVQVLIYLIYYHYIKNQKSVIMTTCDMVVFMLCLNLAIPCIYTGAYNPPGLKLDPNKKYYSVLEYKPSEDPYRDALIRLKNKFDAIAQENQAFVIAITELIKNSDTPIMVNDVKHYFTREFYTAIFNDVSDIQSEFLKNAGKIVNKYSNSRTTQDTSEIERELKDVTARYLLVPFLKIKKGTTKKIQILMTKSYTAQKPCDNRKPSIKALLDNLVVGNTETESRKTFLDLALKHFTNQTPAMQRGGGELSDEQISLFPEDEDDYSLYNYVTNGEIENDSEVYNVENSDLIFNPSITPDKEEYNLLTTLHDSFNETLNGIESENWKDTIYTLYLYESYLDGVASDIFSHEDYERIVNDYELSIKEEPELQDVAAGLGLGLGRKEEVPGSPRGPSGDGGIFPFSPHYDSPHYDSPGHDSQSDGYQSDGSLGNYSQLDDGNLSDGNLSDDSQPPKKRRKVYGGAKNNNKKTRRLIKKRKYRKTRNTKKTKRNKTIKKQRQNKKKKHNKTIKNKK